MLYPAELRARAGWAEANLEHGVSGSASHREPCLRQLPLAAQVFWQGSGVFSVLAAQRCPPIAFDRAWHRPSIATAGGGQYSHDSINIKMPFHDRQERLANSIENI